MTEYVTHKREDGNFQLLSEHLYEVAKRAETFADTFQASKHGRRVGLLHDIGKYSINGQKRQRDPEHTAKTDHSTAGAKEAYVLKDAVAAFVIAGHHGGLPDRGENRAPQPGTLFARLRKELSGGDDPSAWHSEISIDPHDPCAQWAIGSSRFALSFYTRMLFSCLVDADYLDTEASLSQEPFDRGGGDTICQLNDKMNAEAQKLLTAQNKSPINEKRCKILADCLKGSEMPQGLYTLTVPTGGGKTKASMAFALSHAKAHGLRRVIYVIPYTSIIEQNAKVFADLLGEQNVLEHHSNTDFDPENSDDTRRMLACENWDAPVVVTTAVQFFESLFAAKTSKCRKLHNIAQSAVIFDEAQMLPQAYIKPCVAAIVELVKHYGVTAVLCTATQPALNDLVLKFDPDMKIREIARDTDDLFRFFRRVRFERKREITIEQVANGLSAERQALCIVNTRANAREIFSLLDGDGLYCLTTLLTPKDRSDKLSEIRQRLQNKQRCIVVSTSLIEAGVDVDFPTVWREECGLDSILQAAGRCNREGKRNSQDSVVYIFSIAGRANRHFQQNISSMNHALEKVPQPDTCEAIQAYFTDLLYLLNGEESLDKKRVLEACEKYSFKTAAENFHLIEEDTITVFIPTENNRDLIERLRRGERSRDLMRKLSKDAVNIYPQHFASLKPAMMLFDGGYPLESFAILEDRSLYSTEHGLANDVETGIGFYV